MKGGADLVTSTKKSRMLLLMQITKKGIRRVSTMVLGSRNRNSEEFLDGGGPWCRVLVLSADGFVGVGVVVVVVVVLCSGLW
jgi:hypothetical protein